LLRAPRTALAHRCARSDDRLRHHRRRHGPDLRARFPSRRRATVL